MNLNEEIRHINRRLEKIEDELNHQKKNQADAMKILNDLEVDVSAHEIKLVGERDGTK